MYLSSLTLDASKRITREIYINPYTLHQAVFRAFPDKLEDGPGRVLYRLDTHNGNFTLLVQSEKLPNWIKAEILSECLAEPVKTKLFAPKFGIGQQLYFLLRANPSVKKDTEGKKNGYRIGLLREEDQMHWLSKKAKTSGFSVVSCIVIPEGIAQNERGKEGKGKLRHYAVRFNGILQVVEPDLFIETVQKGIGPAKGFGFGLLSLAPLKG